jgi:ribosomal protein S18 acetylase RimI-like enzyme
MRTYPNPAPPASLRLEFIDKEDMDDKEARWVDKLEKLFSEAKIGVSRFHDKCLIAKIGNKLVGGGFYGLRPGRPQTASFDIVVDPKVRGKGIGEALINKFLRLYQDDARTLGDDVMLMVEVVNPIVEKVLDRKGYLRVEEGGRVYYLDPEEVVVIPDDEE